ncbi:hypothetical protein [Mesorhizobium ventifaucium]|nr:hypothetical protein [Mesorhizobium ventifaucium]
MSLVIGGSFESMTAATPLARYSAVESALASGFATADLHHAVGHDRFSLFTLSDAAAALEKTPSWI